MFEQRLMVPRDVHGRLHYEDYGHPIWKQSLSPRHVHRFLELFLVVRGRAVVLVGSRRMDVRAGALWWIPPGVEHALVGPSQTHRRYNLSMRSAAVRRTLSKKQFAPLLSPDPGDSISVQLSADEASDLEDVFEEVAKSQSEETSLRNAALAFALTRAYRAYRDASPAGDPIDLEPTVARALSLLREDGLSLGRDAVAEHCGVSPTQLSRLFTRELGESFVSVRNRRRVARAVALVDEGRCASLLEAALESGFGSYSQFHRTYVRLVGRRPSDTLSAR